MFKKKQNGEFFLEKYLFYFVLYEGTPLRYAFFRYELFRRCGRMSVASSIVANIYVLSWICFGSKTKKCPGATESYVTEYFRIFPPPTTLGAKIIIHGRSTDRFPSVPFGFYYSSFPRPAGETYRLRRTRHVNAAKNRKLIRVTVYRYRG